MPRRPPRKPPADLDLSRHLLRPEELAAPLDPVSLFSASFPVELEVGSGKGMFLAAATAANPGTNYLGIEVSGGYARLAAAKLAAANCPNGRMIHGDAMQLVSSLLPDCCLRAVHVYFPDPWWKARHRKRRILNPVFLAHAARLLDSTGQLHIWTDVEEYFQEAVVATAATGRFGPPAEEPAGGPGSDYRTHFERRTRLAGAPVWRAVFQRNDQPAAVARLDLPSVSPGSQAAE
ncbi:MAG: tRNA (guanosine(46)-N7)-methyltransferase TrmB [Planctomycetia bacterium]|jgi:tRNA (guanine-N7-)-methyltransferase|nr:tRNA (guanosine(46)-N7)-methyltransferase TrmB [Planctomycetia bacterium]